MFLCLLGGEDILAGVFKIPKDLTSYIISVRDFFRDVKVSVLLAIIQTRVSTCPDDAGKITVL